MNVSEESSPSFNISSKNINRRTKANPLVKNKGSIKFNEVEGFLEDLQKQDTMQKSGPTGLKMVRKISTPNFFKPMEPQVELQKRGIFRKNSKNLKFQRSSTVSKRRKRTVSRKRVKKFNNSK
mmetsp:Transcript_33176/g.32570  ORF Transcript_33176/g.32570 Transcript_33176/m.32570 type:complete len:123 (-) Transcript_33176:349-717(-)